MIRGLDAELAFALELADLADGITMPPFAAREVVHDWKPNRTEVTELDRGAEAAIAARLTLDRPDHRMLGEEFGTSGDPDSPWQWIVDPIDGTSGYVRGIPVWATLIALAHRDDGVVVGVVSAPAMGRRWWASRGAGTFADGRACRVSAIDAIADAQISITLNDGWEALGLTGAVVGLATEARRARGFGDFWQHCLVAEGALDVAIDAVGVAPYDLAAVKLIVEEAGGAFTDRHGRATHESDTAISSNGRLHAEVMRRFGTRGSPPRPMRAAGRHGEP